MAEIRTIVYPQLDQEAVEMHDGCFFYDLGCLSGGLHYSGQNGSQPLRDRTEMRGY